MRKIVKIDLSPKVYGGRIYENEVLEQLDGEVKFEKVFLMKYNFKLFNLPRILFLTIKYRYFFKGELFLNDRTTFLAGKKAKKNYIIIHHIDSSYSSNMSFFFNKITVFWLQKNKKLFHNVIAVSEYWKGYLSDTYSFKNIDVIYNSFNSKKYTVTDAEKEQFVKKYNLLNKPIIYIGNAQEKKGVKESYEALKNLDVHIVTSGRPQIKLECLNLHLNHREYVILLAASAIVITMSKFLEGWNRTAHEAILVKTTVIGSGKGGMLELLEKSYQHVVPNFVELPKVVSKVLKQKQEPSKELDFVAGLNLTYFKKSWTSVFRK